MSGGRRRAPNLRGSGGREAGGEEGGEEAGC